MNENLNLAILMKNVIQNQTAQMHTLGMILDNWKFDRNIHTEIEDIYTIHLIRILVLGNEIITAASALRKGDILPSELWISNLSCQKRYTKKKNNMQKVMHRRISWRTWCKRRLNLNEDQSDSCISCLKPVNFNSLK